MAIDFHGGPRSSLITWLSGAPVRVGYDVPGRGWMYTIRVPRPRHIRPRHAVQNQWDLLNALGIPTPDASRIAGGDGRRSGCRRERREAARGRGRAGRRPRSSSCTSAPAIRSGAGRSTASRSWSSGLAQPEAGRRVVVTSGPSERDAAAAVIEQARARLGTGEARRVLACGEFSLAEFRALMDRAALYIGGDSGPLHIASTSAVPIVGLYGPTLPVRSAPWRAPRLISEAVEVDGLPCRPCDQRRCEPGDFRCLTWLEPNQVLDAAERILARTAEP